MTEAAQSQYICSLDIGSHKIVAVMAEMLPDGVVNVLGTGISSSKGIEQGQVTDFNAAVSAVKKAVDQAAATSHFDIFKVELSISGGHIRSFNQIIAEELPMEEVRQQEIDAIYEKALRLKKDDEPILHVVPQEYRVDNLRYTHNPLQQSGMRLYGNMHIISCNRMGLLNIQKVVKECGLEVGDVVFSGLASAYSVLSDDEKDLGVCLIDFGGGTIDVLLYTDGSLRFSRSYPYAGKAITQYLCREFGTPFSEAEHIKIKNGSALNPPKNNPDKKIEVAGIGGHASQLISKTQLAQRTSQAYTDLLGMIAKDVNQVRTDLYNRGLSYDLGAGVVLTGGGAQIEDIIDCAQPIFNCKVRVGRPLNIEGLTDYVNKPQYATVIGLLQYAFYHSSEDKTETGRPPVWKKWLEKVKTAIVKELGKY
jgi:cell division protein FtsA